MSGPERIIFVGNSASPHLRFWGELAASGGTPVDLVSTRAGNAEWPFGETLYRWPSNNPAAARQAKAALGAVRAIRGASGRCVAHAHSGGKPGWVASMGRMPYLLSVWGLEFRPEEPENARWWTRRLSRRALDRARIITAHTPYLVDALLRRGQPRERVFFLPWGIDRDLFCAARHSSPPRNSATTAVDDILGDAHGPVTLSLRWTDPVYRTDRIVRAFAEALPDCPDAVLVLRPTTLADDSYFERVCALVQDLGIARRVRHAGLLDRPALAELYRRSDVVVSYPESDGYPLSVQEAMCCGAVPMVTRLDSTAGLVRHGETGMEVDTDDLAALAATLRDLLASPDRRRAMRAALPAACSKIPTPGQSRRALLALYDDVLNADCG